MASILIIDHDESTAFNTIDVLARQSWRVTHYKDPFAGLQQAQRNTYGLIIIGETSKRITNSQLCRRLRMNDIDTPILAVAQNYRLDDVVNILEAGADAYMAKPFASRELVARCQALLKRSPRQTSEAIRIANLELDRSKRMLHHKGQPVYLRRREFEILLLLAENHDRVLTRSHINSRTASNYNECDDNCIDVHISNIRKALQQYGCPDVIQTVHGVGYKLRI